MSVNVTAANATYPGFATSAPQSDGTDSRLYVIWIILAVSIMLYLFLSWYDQQLKKRRTLHDAEEEAVQNKHRLILTPQVRRVIFNQAFDINQQTLEICPSNVRSVDEIDVESGECKVDTEAAEAGAKHEASTTHLSKESTVLVFQKERKRKDSDDATESSEEEEETSESAAATQTPPSKQFVTSGLCAICLDPYQQGETIVWSQDRECPHVYHKECFLDYLSNKKNTDLKDNPCPTCRRNFCSVCLV